MADINETKQCQGKIMHVWKYDMETVALTRAATFRIPQRKLCTSENNCLREWMEQRRSSRGGGERPGGIYWDRAEISRKNGSQMGWTRQIVSENDGRL